MVNKLEIVRKAVREIANEVDWKYHIVPVLNYAKQLAKFFQVDEEVLELAVLLHDIGRFKFGKKDHHLTGLPETEKILKQANYSAVIIKEVKHCVKAHRGSVDIPPETLIAKIVVNADAMSHFDILPIFFLLKIDRQLTDEGIAERVKWIEAKIERDWNKKLTIPRAKDMVRKKYQAIKLVLDSTKNLM